jgi:hypothetical protein
LAWCWLRWWPNISFKAATPPLNSSVRHRMQQDAIAEIEIDATGQLHVVPSSCTFPYIYREAMEVHWNPERRSLCSPVPREWSYARWFEQIVAAAREQGWLLHPTTSTSWRNIPESVKAEFLRVAAGHL